MAQAERSAGFVVFHSQTGTSFPTKPTVQWLILDYGRHWDLPKGHLQSDEDDLTAALRELKEETGIADLHVIPGFRHEIHYFFRNRKRQLVRKTVAFFLAEVASRDVLLSDEHVAYEYLPFDLAMARITYAGTRAVVRAANDLLVARAVTP